MYSPSCVFFFLPIFLDVRGWIIVLFKSAHTNKENENVYAKPNKGRIKSQPFYHLKKLEVSKLVFL